ncbi:transcriptional regulator, PadR family [Haloechinothrix alba]|uniref:Transcriptional regulator, PadR family n=2 Tax=Haloechinothrix TaxID=1425377 RepID=A0A238ZT69_9PSEU|nr:MULTISPECIES: PadR family transcriptional regulator [Haloechinothrix]MBA0127078.1 PadR family transcriptional regulator [Haloechinothrix aidingensis]SNR86550.1 transcriptional regulator, PadR family [Haloechinothrix alba]
MADINATSAALLGLLHDGPATGGQLVASAEAAFGTFFSVTRSQVYRELPVLADAGLVRLGKRGARSSQQYVLTAAGKKAFRQWVNAESGPDHIRSTLILRLVNSGTVTDKQRAELIETARARYKEDAATAKANAREAAEAGDPIAQAIADFGHAYARAALKLVDAVENA